MKKTLGLGLLLLGALAGCGPVEAGEPQDSITTGEAGQELKKAPQECGPYGLMCGLEGCCWGGGDYYYCCGGPS